MPINTSLTYGNDMSADFYFKGGCMVSNISIRHVGRYLYDVHNASLYKNQFNLIMPKQNFKIWNMLCLFLYERQSYKLFKYHNSEFKSHLEVYRQLHNLNLYLYWIALWLWGSAQYNTNNSFHCFDWVAVLRGRLKWSLFQVVVNSICRTELFMQINNNLFSCAIDKDRDEQIWW